MKENRTQTTDPFATEDRVKHLQKKLDSLILAILLVLFILTITSPYILSELGYDFEHQMWGFAIGILIILLTLLALTIFSYLS